MNSHPIKRYFEARKNALIQLSEAVVHAHSGTAGTAREMLIQELLVAHLPSALGVGTGLVFGFDWAHSGKKDDISTQQDVIVYRKDFPVLEVGGAPLFFRESVVATIEVKTNYVASELPGVFENAVSVGKVRPTYITTFQLSEDKAGIRGRPSRPVLSGIFYFRGLESRSPMVHKLNGMLDEKAAGFGALWQVPGPDFIFSPKAGLIVRESRFHTLADEDNVHQDMDNVHGGLTAEEKRPGAYRRVFGSENDWKGILVLILELAERCQRYPLSYATLSQYL